MSEQYIDSIMHGATIKLKRPTIKLKRLSSSSVLHKQILRHSGTLFCFLIWVWNLVSHFKGRNRLGHVREQSVMKIFWPKPEEVTGGRRQLHKEELRDLYSSAYIIRLKNRGRQEGWNTWDKRARTERHAGFWWETLNNKDSLNDLGVDRIILKWISNRTERRGLD